MRRAWLALALCACEPTEAECDGPRCVENVLVTCVGGEAVETACGEMRCAVDAPVPQCVPADAMPCDADTEASCRAGLQLLCDETSLYLTTTPCDEDHLCVGDPGACEAFDDIDCDEAGWSPLCVDGRLIECVDGHPAAGSSCI